MLVHDTTVSEQIGKFRAVVLMNLCHDLISRIQLFYDSSPFKEKRGEIFAK